MLSSQDPYLWLANATEIAQWAERLVARSELPRIVRLLINASISTRDLRRCEFRAGEGVNLPGWDGIVDTVCGNQWVPSGQSLWEMGTNQDATRKANLDYGKRTKDPLGMDPRETAFVFVTPRRWGGKDAWAAARSAEGKWRDVKAYDADSLEQWLTQNPAVHAIVTRMLGRNPTGVSDLGSWWTTFSRRTTPALPVDFLLAGRASLSGRLTDWLSKAPSTTLCIDATSPQEAVGFVASALHRLPEKARLRIEAQCVVVTSPDAWSEVLARARGDLLLITTFPPEDLGVATAAGHHVLIAVDQNWLPTGDVLTLPRLGREEAIASLMQAGQSRDDAESLVTVAQRSFLSFQRRLASAPEVARPAWAQPDRFPDVLPAVFAGAWQEDHEADRGVLEELAGRPYSSLSETLVAWREHADPPVRSIGGLWFVVSKEDAWSLGARFLTSDQLARYRNVILGVLTADDSPSSAESGPQWPAKLFGNSGPSEHLRSGLTDTLAFIGARGGIARLPGGVTFQAFADDVVMSVLAWANADTSGYRWRSLQGVLPSLAEASPEQFLTMTESGLRSGLGPNFFNPSAEADLLGWPAHAGLLFALESLAWTPEYLGRVSSVLGKLAEADPGGRWANRPISSLRAVFLPWAPQTRATLGERLGILERLRLSHPAVAWNLMLSLLPRMHDVSSSIHVPRWREGQPAETPTGVPVDQLLRHASTLTGWLIEACGLAGERWSALVRALQHLPSTDRETVLVQLEQLDPSAFSSMDQRVLMKSLREVRQQHTAFATAPWAMQPSVLGRLELVLGKFETTFPLGTHSLNPVERTGLDSNFSP